VVEAGSMAKAAERLGTSQPAVSRSIADLEHTLGVRLLERSPWGVEPTQYGHAIIRRGVAVFDELRQGVKDIEFLADPTAGELRIGCPEVIAAGPILAIVNRLTRRHPRIVFHVATGSAPAIYRGLMERTIEVGITRVAGPLDEEVLRVETLFNDILVVAAGARNPLTRRRRIELAELVNELWALPAAEGAAGAAVVEAFRASGLDYPRATLVSNSVEVRLSLVAAGRFLTIAPFSLSRFRTGRAELKVLPVELPMDRLPVVIATLKNRTLSPVAKLFIEHAHEVAKALTQRK